MNPYGEIKPPRYPWMIDAAEAIESLPGELEDFLPFVGAAPPVLRRWGYGEKADTLDKAFLGMDALDAVPGVGGALAMAAGPMRSTIRGAQRKAFPGIYKSPESLLEEASARVEPENPMLGRLFDTSREELAQISRREGDDYAKFLPGLAQRPKGTAHADLVTKPANTGRLVDALQNARGSDLATGMEGWYTMDPMYDRILDLVDGDKVEAARRFEQLNSMMGIHSANADVAKEINRGTSANWLNEQGRLGDYFEYANKNDRLSGRPDRPVDMDGVHGHYAHKTAHGLPLRNYLAEGDITSKAPKVPAYIGASGIPGVGKGGQNTFPVGDAHFSRMIGLADTRPGQMQKGKEVVPDASWSMPEAQQLTPWWTDVAAEAGYNPVQGQAVGWGLFSPQTGVQSAVGAPKLEIFAGEVEKAANRMGVSPEVARDQILMGKGHAGFVDPSMLKWLGLLGAGGYIGSGLLEDDVEESEMAKAFKPREY